MRSIDGKLDDADRSMEETVAKAVEAATADIIARVASLEDTVLTLAEALLRPAHPRPAAVKRRAQRPELATNRIIPNAKRLDSTALPYSHSMVPGGLLVTSRTTRLTSRTSLVIRVEIRASRS